MRLRRLLGLALVGAAAAAAVRRFRGTNDTVEMSPINKDVPGDEPIAEEDVPEDHAG